MPFELREANLPQDFPAFARLMFEVYEDPPQGFFHTFFPIHGEGEKAREEAIAEAATRLESWHVDDPSSYWQKIIETETGKLVGTTIWHIYPQNPFEEDHESSVTWFPDDGSRKFAEQVIEQIDAPRAQFCRRPHIFMFIISVHPSYRRRGIAQQFLDWGMRKSDEMGIEFFLDATPVGKPLYDKNGFVCVKENVIIPHTDAPDEAWKKTEAKVGPVTFWPMWRPAGGYVEGETIKPWEQE